MPILQLTYAPAAGRRPLAKTEIARAVLGPTAAILKKKPELTALTLRSVDPEDWFIAGTPLARHGLGSFFLEIRITDGTNTKAEKAAYIAAVFAALRDLLGPLHAESYVHVDDVRAEAYGYGGLTQEFRFIADRIDAEERERRSDRALAHGVR